MTIVFLVDAFPSVSETFILNQITGLIDLGHDVYIFSAARPTERDFHDDIRKYDLLKKTYYHNDREQNRFVRFLWAILLLVSYGHRNFKAVLNSLNFFKYGKEALSLNYLYKLMLFLSVGKIDVVFCHYGPNGNFASIIKEMGLNFKIVTMFHGYDIRKGIDQGGKIYAPLFKTGDIILSISEYNYKNLLIFGAPVEKIKHHPVGIDLQRYTYKEKTIKPNESIKILTVSRLVKEKGIEFGLRAIAKLFHDHGIKNLEYQIIGDGPFLKRLKQLAEDLGIKEHVHFLGSHTQTGVIEMLHHSHIFFLPSIAEALPVVLMEAQAAGLPIVATKVGSVDQVVIDGESAYLVPKEDVDAMADKLLLLIKNSDQWAKMTKAGRVYVQQKYDIKVLNKNLEKIFSE